MIDPDGLVASWIRAARPAASEHAASEIRYVMNEGNRPLQFGDRVPGCACRRCDPKAVRPAPQRADDDFPVEQARRTPILDVAERLGLGEPVRRGREWAVCCPFHDDNRPSLTLSDAGLWYCFVCAEGGDGIELWQRVRGVPFAEAVRELAA